MKSTRYLFLGSLVLGTTLSVMGQSTPEDVTEFTLYGFGRTTFVWDDQDMKRSDLFVPANITVNGNKIPNFFVGSKQTRLGFDVKHLIGSKVLDIKIEGDFHNDATDATGLFRMRHAYVNYKFVMIGMNWSNFFDEEVNPVVVDFEGPNSSTLSRTPQIRFSTYAAKNVLSISLENPIENVTLGGPVTVLPERFPDVIAGYRINGTFGFVKAAALLRELRYESDQPRSLLGYGLTLMTSVKTGKSDKVKFQAVTGTGVARYIQGASGLNYDAIYNGTNELETVPMHGSNVSYQHYWKNHMHSSLTVGYLGIGDNTNLGANSFKSGFYSSANLFWDPVKNLTFGWEAVLGQRRNTDNASGSALRLQMNATYKFNKSIN